jgi:hypothetical protein
VLPTSQAEIPASWLAPATTRADVPFATEEYEEGPTIDLSSELALGSGAGSLLLLGPNEARLVRGAHPQRRQPRPLSSRRFALGFGGEMVHPSGMMSKTSKGVRVRGAYALESGMDVEMSFAYAPLRIEGQLVGGDDSGPMEVHATQDQITMGMGLRRTYRPHAPKSFYWSFVGGVANVPGTALVKSSENATAQALDTKWGYFLQPRLGLVFAAKEVPALSLDVSAGVDIISWTQFSTIQQTLTLGLRYAL